MSELMLQIEEVATSQPTQGKRDKAISGFIRSQGLKPQSKEAKALRSHAKMVWLMEENRIQHIGYLMDELDETLETLRDHQRNRHITLWEETKQHYEKVCRQITNAGGKPPPLSETDQTPPAPYNHALAEAHNRMVEAKKYAMRVRQEQNQKAFPDEQLVRQAEVAAQKAQREYKEEETKDRKTNPSAIPLCYCGRTEAVAPPHLRHGGDIGDYAPCGDSWEGCILFK